MKTNKVLEYKEKDMIDCGVTENMALNRNKWKGGTHKTNLR